MKRATFLSLIASTAVAAWLSVAPPAMADLMELSNLPLFLGFKAEPNIFFVIDDSGSMDWEVMTQDTNRDGRFTSTHPDGTNPSGTGPVTHRDSNDDGNPNCRFGQDGQDFYGYIYGVEFGSNTYDDDGNDCNTADDQAWRFRTNAFNPLYFNPHRIYKPWSGLNKNSDPFPEMAPEAALANAYDPTSETINLLQHNSNWLGGIDRDTSDRDNDGQDDGFYFYTWVDTDGDGQFDNNEKIEHQLNNLDPTLLTSLIPTFGQGNPVTQEMVQNNFANWFSYHRSREYVAKAAYGEVIASVSDVRMGLSTLHNHNNVKTPIRHMNPEPDSGDKKRLLDALYQIHSESSTPLRNALKQAGRYLECQSNDLFSSCPALTEAEGGACQQNFAIVMTDGFYNGSSPSVGNTDTSNSKWDGGAYADNYSNTLADVAMHFYERDLSNLDNYVPITPGIDEARHQHIVTYTVSFGLNGTLTAPPPNNTDPFSWPDPTSSNAAKIDDLLHTAYNGRGEYFTANRPEELTTALHKALSSISDRVSSAASVALNSGSYSTDSRLYQARFNSGDWSGQLLSYPIGGDGQVLSAAWDAGEILNTQHWDTGRTILTYDREATQGIQFRWAKLSPTMQGQLSLNSQGDVDDKGEKRLQYLRGNKALEGQLFRTRLRTLGDLIHSDPYYTGPPKHQDEVGENYQEFKSTQQDRIPMIYVGSNDGMLHGFRAEDGQETLAYIPGAIFHRLKNLTDFSYQHEYFVDGAPTVGDAFGNFGSGCGLGGSCWRSMLISGMRRGGQALFALDVTNPSQFGENHAAQIALWEFTDRDDADLGYTFSQPSIVKMANDRWAAVIGNGYNSTENDGYASTTGYPSLFIIFLDGGLDGVWTRGTDYIKISTNHASATPNGLASPSPVDIDGDFKTDYIYAGDLLGNVWKFDVHDPSPANWHRSSVPLFTATSRDGNVQPITSRMEAGRHPEEGVMIYFGTGKYIEKADATNAIPVQTFYGIWDSLTEAQPIPNRLNNLVQQTIESEANGQRITSKNEIHWDTGDRGWYLDLDKVAGERQVSRPILRNGRIIFTTLIPSTDVCGFGGDSWLMEVEAVTGSRLSQSPFDINDDGKFDDADLVPHGSELVAVSGLKSTEGILPTPTVLSAPNMEFKYASGTAGGVEVFRERPGMTPARSAWRQLH